MGKVARIHVWVNEEKGISATKDFRVQPFETVVITKGQVFGVRVEIGHSVTTSDGIAVWDGGIPIECDKVEVFDVET